MKKIALFALMFAVMLLVSCKKSNSPEAVFNDYFAAMDAYLGGMEKAGSADDVVKVIDKFSTDMQAIAPRLKALGEKYPELKGMKGDKLPPELKQFEKKFEEMAPKMMGVIGKMMQYMNDPKVTEANQRLQKAMQDLQ
jgi:hypothetical protein